MQETDLLQRLSRMLKWKKSRKFYAEQLNISEAEVDSLIKEINSQTSDIQTDAEVASYISALEERIVEQDLEKGTLKSSVVIDYEPKTIEELYELHKIDKEKFKISNYWSKLKSSGKFTSSVFAVCKKKTDYTQEDFQKFLSNYKPAPIQINVGVEDESLKPSVDISLSIADFHLAKKTLQEESIQDRKDAYMHILNSLVYRVNRVYSIDTVAFVISNDFFHTDNYHNSTTNGTPQDVIASYDNEYEEGFDLMVRAISTLSQHANSVKVILVQGNHDRTKSFYMAHALEHYFKADPRIVFDRSHDTIKHVVLGSTFIGYHHGNCKIEDLPLLFATSNSAKDFGNAKYREVHTGDKHHYMAKEVKGVRIQQMPSLSGTDRWHKDNNYVNSIRAALVMIYHPLQGKIGEFEERIWRM